MSIVTNDCGSPHPNVLVNSHHSGSAAEKLLLNTPSRTLWQLNGPYSKNEGKVILLTQLIVTLVGGSMDSTVI